MENNIEFYKMLEVNLLNEDLIEDNENICLINKAPLDDKYFVKLPCGHSFDYKALYNELFSQKFRFDNYRNNSKSIIKCPYCRQVISDVLPFYPELGLELIYGVNTDDKQYRMVIYNSVCVYANTVEYHTGVCNFIYPKQEESDSDFICSCNYVVLHKETNKTYCSAHINIIKRNYIKEQMKAKKSDLKEKKRIEKELQKVLQKKEKATKKKNMLEELDGENVIISLNPIIPLEVNPTKCTRILKYGKNIGKQCGCKIFQDGVCKKHCVKEVKEEKDK